MNQPDEQTAPVCPYCGEEAIFSDGHHVYGRPAFGGMWVCWNYPQCDAYVGCHRGTRKPLGTLANGKLRRKRKLTHAVFDPLWRNALRLYDIAEPRGTPERKKAETRIIRRARTRAYQWLAYRLGVDEVHIAQSDLALCERIILECSAVTPKYIRDWAKARQERSTEAVSG